ncbi:MAG: hypothetical protein PHH58_10240 [Rhodoferax sp.]|nr:hypothetical protein [Rhodoferax sp.]
MKYVIRIPAINGDVIPLIFVAVEMATAASTAYGRTQPHKPIYNGRLPGYVKLLLNESRAGRLHVCNQFEHQGPVEELISAAKSSGELSEVSQFLVEPDWEKLHRENPHLLSGLGVWDFTELDLGPSKIDWDATYLGCLYVKLHHLNEWGKANGDEFTISTDSVEWIDERGVMRPTEATGKTAKPVVTEEPASDGPAPLTTGDVALCFAGLRNWDEKRWKDELGSPDVWLKDCQHRPGTRGRGGIESTWWPIKIGDALIRQFAVKINSVRGKFQSQPLLEPWREEWKTYEADNFNVE